MQTVFLVSIHSVEIVRIPRVLLFESHALDVIRLQTLVGS